MQKRKNSGQALVLVLLSLAVVLTLVLFVLARSVTDVAVSSRSEDAVRAFSAAEAGVEQALIVGSGSSSQVGNASFSSVVTNYASAQQAMVYPINLSPGETSTIWFKNHDSSGNTVCDAQHPCFTGRDIQVCWGKSGTSNSVATTPAIEFILTYESTPNDPSTAKIVRSAIDPNSTRTATNGFSSPDAGTCTINGESFQFQKTFNLSTLGVPAGSYNVEGGLYYAKIRMFYNSDQNQNIGFNVALAGGTLLPTQGLQVDSSGTAGQSQRRLSVFQGWSEMPSDFEYGIYSPAGVTK